MIAAKDPYALFEAARTQSPNPFSLEQIISANEVWGEVMADLPSLNQHIDQKVNQVVSEVRQKFSKKVGIVIKGDRGTGKSHVIHRIWKEIEQEGGAFFSYLPPCGNPSRIDSHVRLNLCNDFARRDIKGITQWQKLAAALVSTLKGTEYEAEYKEYLNRKHEPEQLKKYILESVGRQGLENFFDGLTEAILEHQEDLDFNFLKAVLFTIFRSTKLAQVSLAWLKGEDHPSIKQAGLPEYTLAEQDERAIWFIQQLCKLAEVVSKPVVICFDQLEAYENDINTGDSKNQAVAKCIDRIYFQCSNVILLSCLQDDTWRQDVAQMQGGIPDRIGQFVLTSKPPTADQLIELVKLRLDWFYNQNRLNPSDYPYLYPFQEDELRKVANEAASARHVFKKWCLEKFERSSPTPSSPRGKREELLDDYNELLGKIVVPLKDDDELASIIACTIKMLSSEVIEGVEVKHVEKVNASSTHDLHLIVSGYDSTNQKDVRIGVRVCETTNAKTFIAVMKRLLNYKQHKITRGCLIRSTPIPLSWRKGKELEQKLREQDGGEVVVLKKEEIKPLAVLEKIYQQSADYDFDQEELIQLIQELGMAAENPLLREILSAPL